ncbi:MAG TPA: FKBP-type peptidyl-prolyl cis-trans isomerase [Micromonosporaceae bacterium]
MDTGAPTKPPTSNRKQTPAEERRAVKNQRKNAAREALRRQEAARRRRNAALGVGAAVVVVVGGILLATLLPASKAKPTAATSPSAAAVGPTAPASSAPSAAPSAAPTAATYVPKVPAGESSALKKEPVVKAGTGTVSKLATTTLIQGNGPVIKKGDTITVQYVGVTYKDGKVFDSSWKDGQDFTTAIGAGKVIPGWDDSIPGMKVGSRVQIDIPAAQAYGETTTDGSPAGDLRFVVDLLSDAGPTPATPAS